MFICYHLRRRVLRPIQMRQVAKATRVGQILFLTTFAIFFAKQPFSSKWLTTVCFQLLTLRIYDFSQTLLIIKVNNNCSILVILKTSFLVSIVKKTDNATNETAETNFHFQRNSAQARLEQFSNWNCVLWNDFLMFLFLFLKICQIWNLKYFSELC
jgi:hypothetical protein